MSYSNRPTRAAGGVAALISLAFITGCGSTESTYAPATPSTTPTAPATTAATTAATTTAPAPRVRVAPVPVPAPRVNQERSEPIPESTEPSPRPAESPRSEGSTYYKNCAAARDAGAAPIRRGEPGYRDPLDADDDGIACEAPR
jgi:hypothetical protein